MHKTFSVAALSALLAIPLMVGPTDAFASCHSRKTTGTVLGGVGGALVGNSISRGGGGAVIGGLGGAVLGHEIGRAGCARRVVHYRTTTRTRYAASPDVRPVRKVYYDQQGNPISTTYYRQ